MNLDRRRALRLFGSAGVLSAALGTVLAVRPTSTQPAEAAGTQFRGLWLSTVENVDWPGDTGLSVSRQKSQLRGILDRAQAYRFNAIIGQVRPNADTFWPSKLEPWSKWLTGKAGKNPGYDPLAYQIDQCHKRGLEFHAWFNPFRICSSADFKKLPASHPGKKHPSWTVRYAGSVYYNPGLPEVRRHVRRVVLEVVGRYKIDGVHFDDYFYPYPVDGKKFDDDKAFKKHGGGKSRGAWRRANITSFVADIHSSVKRVRPGVRFGISPFGIWRNKENDSRGSNTHGGESYSDNYADTYAWIKKGYVDYVVPQLYWKQGFKVADYNTLARWWAGVVKGTKVRLFIGQGAYRLGEEFGRNELDNHLSFDAKIPQITGEVFFSAHDMMKNKWKVFSRIANGKWKSRAVPWPATKPPKKPSPPAQKPQMSGGAVDMSGGVVQGNGGMSGGVTPTH